MAERIVDHARLRDLRLRKLLSQEALAARAGVVVRTVIRAESGKHTATDLVLHKLAQTLEVEVNELLVDPEPTEDAA